MKDDFGSFGEFRLNPFQQFVKTLFINGMKRKHKSYQKWHDLRIYSKVKYSCWCIEIRDDFIRFFNTCFAYYRKVYLENKWHAEHPYSYQVYIEDKLKNRYQELFQPIDGYNSAFWLNPCNSVNEDCTPDIEMNEGEQAGWRQTAMAFFIAQVEDGEHDDCFL